ncbi:nucleotidyltransferase family protein [Chitinophaga sp.]|uniref:nucleotidyltransferase family protein n=1 Tax=Chitinophaga sp. TaxID=1869181 RepID=UPI0031DA2634
MKGIVILAAGASTRLGRPKQLLLYKGDTLLNNAVKAALGANVDAVAVVLGAAAELVQQGITVPVVINAAYEEGMASSIRCGVEYMMAQGADKIMLMVCDQPYVDAAHLSALLLQQETTGAKIAASYYEGRKGVPALFDKSLFPELLALRGDVGARQVIEKHAANAVIVPFPAGAVDIDTEQAYNALG